MEKPCFHLMLNQAPGAELGFQNESYCPHVHWRSRGRAPSRSPTSTQDLQPPEYPDVGRLRFCWEACLGPSLPLTSDIS